MGPGIQTRVRQASSADCQTQSTENFGPAEEAGGNNRSDTQQ